MRTEIYDLIVAKISQLTQVDVSTLTEDTNLKADLGLRSMELAAIVAALEEEYDAYIKYTALMHAHTIGQLADASLKEIEG